MDLKRGEEADRGEPLFLPLLNAIQAWGQGRQNIPQPDNTPRTGNTPETPDPLDIGAEVRPPPRDDTGANFDNPVVATSREPIPPDQHRLTLTAPGNQPVIFGVPQPLFQRSVKVYKTLKYKYIKQSLGRR